MAASIQAIKVLDLFLSFTWPKLWYMVSLAVNRTEHCPFTFRGWACDAAITQTYHFQITIINQSNSCGLLLKSHKFRQRVFNWFKTKQNVWSFTQCTHPKTEQCSSIPYCQCSHFKSLWLSVWVTCNFCFQV